MDGISRVENALENGLKPYAYSKCSDGTRSVVFRDEKGKETRVAYKAEQTLEVAAVLAMYNYPKLQEETYLEVTKEKDGSTKIEPVS